MMDFNKAMKAGMLAAKKARQNKNEINIVIASLNKEVRSLSNDTIELKITNEKKLSPKINQLAVGLSALTGVSPYVEFQAISINKIDRPSEKEILAEFRVNPSDGYPCVISYNNKDISCRDMKTLMEALNNLMADAQTGEKLLGLLPSEDVE